MARFLCALLALIMVGNPIVAEPYRRPAAVVAVAPPPPEGMGCYWYRQRYYCGRYCYWEVNGKRYCREREREAYPQGVVETYGWWPMK